MYKVILVDDEAVVREGLKRIIDWGKHGFELVGDFMNGREALEAVEQLRPDLVLSDISMPFMNGLELCEQLSIHYPLIKTIILTGYDDFEYAQRALRLKVSDFILKPITAAETRTLLDKVKLEMDEERRRREDVNRLYSQLNQSLPLLKERFLERMVVAGIGPAELAERLAFFGLASLAARAIVLVFDIDDFGQRAVQAGEPNAELLRFAAFNIVEEVVLREQGLVFRTREERMAAVLWSDTNDEPLYETAYRIAEEARQAIETYLHFTVTAGIGRACDAPKELPLTYKSAVAALDYRFLLGKNRVIGILDVEGAPPSSLMPGRDWDRQLAAAVKTGSALEAQQLIEHIAADLKNTRMPIEACHLQMQKIVVSLLNTVQELGIDEWSLASEHRIALSDMSRYKTLDELQNGLKVTVHAAMSAIADNRNSLTRMQIVRATAYIDEHYASEKLSLQELCRHVLMSASYFSLVFKQQTGETFVEYLTRVRMDKAKELLRHTSLKLYEIAAKVGYADPNYFSILFKKHVGVTPSEYREDKPAKEKLS
jgi:two-component system response regulator YesN